MIKFLLAELLVAILVTLAFSGCGVGNGGIYGTRDEEFASRIADLERRVSDLEKQIQSNIAVLNTLIAVDEDTADTLRAVQSQVNSQVIELASLQNYLNSSITILSLINPCGDGPGFDEVILKLSSGQYLAYFEHGNNRFLSVIQNGSYETTDAQKCRFTIDNSGKLCDNLGCR